MQFVASEIQKQHHLNAWIGKYDKKDNIFIILTIFYKEHGYNNMYRTSKYL